tara:strand:- start:6367 stop:6696 length:330 start_codon:yes stop_codon:yes gene_type:complete
VEISSELELESLTPEQRQAVEKKLHEAIAEEIENAVGEESFEESVIGEIDELNTEEDVDAVETFDDMGSVSIEVSVEKPEATSETPEGSEEKPKTPETPATPDNTQQAE